MLSYVFALVNLVADVCFFFAELMKIKNKMKPVGVRNTRIAITEIKVVHISVMRIIYKTEWIIKLILGGNLAGNSNEVFVNYKLPSQA